MFESLVDRPGSHDDDVIFPGDDVSTVLTSVKKLLQYDMRRRQATAIVLMGVIGAEFQREIEVYSSRNSIKPQTTSARRLEKLSSTPGKDGTLKRLYAHKTVRSNDGTLKRRYAQKQKSPSSE